MPGRYVPVPNPLAQSADHEIDAAFGSDDEDDDNRNETSPLNPNGDSGRTQDTHTASHNDDYNQYHNANSTNTPSHNRSYSQAQRIPGSYDFEADPFEYARPPPGSPPGPTHFAVPNPYGNSNGILPSAPPRRPQPKPARQNVFRRAVGSLLPSYYQQVATDDGEGSSSARLGGGTNNDGVFANLTAKPARGRVVQDGESIYVVPEEVQKEAPPSYAVAQADQAPAYYETIVHAPMGGLDGEVLVEGMPTGSIFTFAWTMLISMSFQFVGFLFTYLLHTTHAARYGSRAGLGITIIQYAFFLRRRAALTEENVYEEIQENSNWYSDSRNDTMSMMGGTPTSSSNQVYSSYFSAATTEWLSFLLMSAGWFILLTSFLGYWRVKRWEAGIRHAAEPAPASNPTPMDRDVQERFFTVFGLPLAWEQHQGQEEVDENGLALTPMPPVDDSPAARAAREREAQLERDLRASGLL